MQVSQKEEFATTKRSQKEDSQGRARQLKKKSLDRQLSCMYPVEARRRKPRNEASWYGFWMSDDELEQLVREIMRD